MSIRFDGVLFVRKKKLRSGNSSVRNVYVAKIGRVFKTPLNQDGVITTTVEFNDPKVTGRLIGFFDENSKTIDIKSDDLLLKSYLKGRGFKLVVCDFSVHMPPDSAYAFYG